jgi:hypothetical protein
MISHGKYAIADRPTIETVHLPDDLGEKPAESRAGSVAGEIDLKHDQKSLCSLLEQRVNTPQCSS